MQIRVPPVAILCALAFALPAASAQISDVSSDEEILFFPAVASELANNKGWQIEITGCIFEPEQGRLGIALLRRTLDLADVELSETESALFAERARLFLVDNERGKRIIVQLGEHRLHLDRSQPNGHFKGTFRFSTRDFERLLRSETNALGQLRFHAVLPERDTREFNGVISVFNRSGWIVVSDIDDTIKVTEVRNRRALLRNTFLAPFRPVDGMAAVYRAWSEKAQPQFFYLSASPWQLYRPLAAFVETNNFPPGVFVLKNFRFKDDDFFNLFQNPQKYKTAEVERLIEQFPDREFVLVGDSGERDPEAFAALAKKHPKQVKRILIRNVTGESGRS
ncbi:MAG TPA: App1 family protein [Verrucomicrobiota bacterium]|nr:App1 family protein [Verrucomicrobiota bacterium]